MSDFSCNVKENIKRLETSLNVERNFDILQREVIIAGRKAGFFFIDGFVREDMAEKLMQFFYSLKESDITSLDIFLEKGMPYTEVTRSGNVDYVITQFLSGVSIMTIDGFDECLLIDCRTYPMRSVSEPWKDRVLRGSRDGFVETIVSNTALIRRRIRNPKLSMEMKNVGSTSHTDVVLCYMEDRVDSGFLQQIEKRLEQIRTDALAMNQESLAECLYPHKWYNPFPKFKYTERPDTAAAEILDGKIVLLTDNSPAVMILPVSVFDIMEEADDFYFPPVTGTYLRVTRFVIALLTLLLTPTWLLFLQNPQWIPPQFAFIKISGDLYVPVFAQLLILEFAIDGLKLAAINTPGMLTTPLSVIAGLVVGEFAVQSGWFNAETMLYMAFVAIANYTQASYELGYALKFMRILLLILTAVFGLAGYAAGLVITFLSLLLNRTVSGESYLYPLIPFDGKQFCRRIFRKRIRFDINLKE